MLLLKKLVLRLMAKLGFVRGALNAESLLANSFGALRALGLDPKVIIDVGANHGRWTRLARSYFPQARYAMLEPQDFLRKFSADLLKSPHVTWHTAGAGKESGVFQLTLADRDDSSSFAHSPDDAAQLGRPQVSVPVVTLSDFIKSEGLPAPDICKIDAEGWDLEVLEGAKDLLGKTAVFFIEATVMSPGRNSVETVVRLMEGHGYRLFDVTDLNRTPRHRVLWLVELVFVKRDGVIDRQVRYE